MKSEKQIVELYGGDVVIEYTDESHRYYLTKVIDELPKKERLTGVSTIAGLIDKSAMLVPWAIKAYTQKVQELMANGENFTRDDVLSMLAIGEQASDEESTKGKDVGTYLHEWAEQYAKIGDAETAYEQVIENLGSPREDIVDQVHVVVMGLARWIEEEGVEIKETEGFVYSIKEGFTGRFDAVIEKDGTRYLVDYKTSNGIYDEHRLQCAAYLKAAEEEAVYLGKKEPFDGALIVSIAKKDKEKGGEIVQKAGEVIAEYRSRAELVKDYKAFKALVTLHKRKKELNRKS